MGKTVLTLTFSRRLFGDEKLLRFDRSEYQIQESLGILLGSRPGALAAVERYAGPKPAELGNICRQNPNLGKTRNERALIADYRRASAVRARRDFHAA